MKYTYFVNFRALYKTEKITGDIVLDLDGKIDSSEKIKEVKNKIIETVLEEIESVVIANFILLKEGKKQ